MSHFPLGTLLVALVLRAHGFKGTYRCILVFAECQMLQSSTLSYVADLVIRRVLADVHTNAELAEALERAYPFDDALESRRIWLDALLRYAVGSSRTLH